MKHLVMLIEQKINADLALKLHNDLSDKIISANSHLDNFQIPVVNSYGRLLSNLISQLTNQIVEIAEILQQNIIEHGVQSGNYKTLVIGDVEATTTEKARWIQIQHQDKTFHINLDKKEVF